MTSPWPCCHNASLSSSHGNVRTLLAFGGLGLMALCAGPYFAAASTALSNRSQASGNMSSSASETLEAFFDGPRPLTSRFFLLFRAISNTQKELPRWTFSPPRATEPLITLAGQRPCLA
jgi:hypothetical protein